MGKSKNFNPKDLVAVFGGFSSKDGKSAKKVLVAEVILVGEKDLLLKEVRKTSAFANSVFKVPQTICVPISIDPENVINDRVLEPQLDDLVASITWEKFKESAISIENGILYKIFYSKGKPTKCLLLVKNEFKEVLFENLMVLQRNSKK